MADQINLKNVERKAQRAYYQDGLMELLLGGYLMVLGSLLFASSSGWVPFVVVMLFVLKPAWERLKEAVTYPRIGYVSFPVDPEAGKGILRGLLIFFVVAGVLAVGMSLLFGSERGLDLWLYRVIPALAGVLLACGPVYAAETFGLKRWYFVAAVFVLSGLIAPMLGAGLAYNAIIGMQMGIVGVINLLIGLWLLVSFVRRHPVLESEEAHANG